MKMTTEHFEALKEMIEPLDTEERRTCYEHGDFPFSSSVKDLDKRYRWDLMYLTGQTLWVCDELYAYLDDTHVDTALRRIVKPLQVAIAA